MTEHQLRSLLRACRHSPRSKHKKDDYFERLAVDSIKNGHDMPQAYGDTWLHSATLE